MGYFEKHIEESIDKRVEMTPHGDMIKPFPCYTIGAESNFMRDFRTLPMLIRM